MKQELSEKWIKAAITGTIWAASEIVLGSFLHNLRIPFSGNILTAIGLIILISISFLWTEKGIFWRAGIICAVMKTMSPSAVIFGPMIAITAEAILLELSTRLLGRTIAGYAIGAMMAMSWNLFQKIMNYIIYYGSNIIEVYTNLLKYAQKQLNIETDIVWLPIIILLVIYALFGLIAAVIGMKVGRKMLAKPDEGFAYIKKEAEKGASRRTAKKFNYSIVWLIADIILMIGSFILLNMTSWIIWSLSVPAIVIIWSLRYKRALRQLSNPRFWIFFVIITLITAFVFTKAQSGDNVLKQGLLTGIQMNFRAVIMVVGFSALGTELYNPVIRDFFFKTSFKNLPLALELSVESLPSFIASIPDFKTMIKNPVSIFYHVISQADVRLSEIKEKKRSDRKVLIVTASVGEGKTTYLKKMVEILRENGIKAGGILSERLLADNKTTGYDLVNIETGERKIFLRENGSSGTEKIGKYSISKEGLEMGNNVLNSLVLSDKTIVIIDEIGLLETEGRGWCNAFNGLLKESKNTIVISVRTSFIDEVVRKWNLQNITIFNIKDSDPHDAVKSVLAGINS